jgi:hypothetical protein
MFQLLRESVLSQCDEYQLIHTFKVLQSQIRLQKERLRYKWPSCTYRVSSFPTSSTIAQLALPHVQNIVGICNEICILFLYEIIYKLVGPVIVNLQSYKSLLIFLCLLLA